LLTQITTNSSDVLVKSSNTPVILTQNSVTPNIILGSTHKTNNTSTTLYSNFQCANFGCADGSVFWLVVDDAFSQLNCTTGSLVCNRGVNYVAKAGDVIDGKFSEDYGWILTVNVNAEIDPALVATPSNTGTGTTLVGPRQYYYCNGTCTVGLPNGPSAGKVYEFCVMNLPGVSTAITLSAATSRYYGKPDQSGYGTQTSGTLSCTAAIGNKLCVTSVDATHYTIISYNGICTAN
jgi:hypothetical protein